MQHFLYLKKSLSAVHNFISLKSSGKTVTLIAYEDKLDKITPCIQHCRYLEIRHEVLAKYVDTVVPIQVHIPLPFIATIFYSY
jgi:hypothetical protein